MRFDIERRIRLHFQIGQSFRPGTPVDEYSLFAGRQTQVGQISRAINQVGQHVIMFGERGVGKTSLSRVLIDVLASAGYDLICPGNINCDSTDCFESLWGKAFRELFRTLEIRNRETNFALDVQEEDRYFQTPDDVRYVLDRIPKPKLIVFDEVDRITNPEATTLLADTIKTLSDHGSNTTIIMIGVADSIDGLIAEHRSIERALVQVHVPRMSSDELLQIITNGMTKVGMNFDPAAAQRIVNLSAGLPHYTHTLALHAAECAVEHDRLDVQNGDVDTAIQSTINRPGSLLSAYELATGSSRQTLFPQVLLACALADKSDLGWFTATSVREPLERITGTAYDNSAFWSHLGAFCTPERGEVLQKSGRARQFRYRFVNPLLQPFVIMHGISKGYIQHV